MTEHYTFVKLKSAREALALFDLNHGRISIYKKERFLSSSVDLYCVLPGGCTYDQLRNIRPIYLHNTYFSHQYADINDYGSVRDCDHLITHTNYGVRLSGERHDFDQVGRCELLNIIHKQERDEEIERESRNAQYFYHNKAGNYQRNRLWYCLGGALLITALVGGGFHTFALSFLALNILSEDFLAPTCGVAGVIFVSTTKITHYWWGDRVEKSNAVITYS